jgi:hypothetical protein
MSQKSKKQTAVEWLISKVNHQGWGDFRIDIPKEIIEQALEMEKEQKEFCWDIAYLSGGFVGKGLPPQEFPTFEQYYAEVYGKE